MLIAIVINENWALPGIEPHFLDGKEKLWEEWQSQSQSRMGRWGYANGG